MTPIAWLLLLGTGAIFGAAEYAWRALEESALQDIDVEDIHVGQPVRYNGHSTPAELRQAARRPPIPEEDLIRSYPEENGEKRGPSDRRTTAKKPNENGSPRERIAPADVHRPSPSRHPGDPARAPPTTSARAVPFSPSVFSRT